MTKTQAFQADESKRDALARALPVVLEAMEAAKDEMEGKLVNEGLANPNIGNAYYQQIVGAKALINRMDSLTRVAKEQKPLPAKRQFSEADRDLLKAQQGGQQ